MRTWLTIFGVVLVCGNVCEGANVWFELDPSSPGYVSSTDVLEDTVATINIVADFEVESIEICAIAVENTDTSIPNQGVVGVGSLHPNLMCHPVGLPDGVIRPGDQYNIVISTIRGSQCEPEGLPAAPGEALYSVEVQAGRAGTTISIDDLQSQADGNPYGSFPCFTMTNGSQIDIAPLHLTIVSQCETYMGDMDGDGDACECPCLGDMDNDGWKSPFDASVIVSHLLPFASVAYVGQAHEGSCADMDDDGLLSLFDLAAIVDELLPYANSYYWVKCPADPDVDEMEWVYIEDPGFNGYMSKYETTNAQYCQFLNEALASGDITVDGNTVYGASGSNGGADFVGQVYYMLDGPGGTSGGATNGGAPRINYCSGSFTVDSGFENHPVTYVSRYGATAFCNYYGFRLPTEWEWRAVADYDGNFSYGCGRTINNNIANYEGSTHPHGTTVVGAFGTYGYGMADMAGNVWEWTSSCWYSDCRENWAVLRGGSWFNSAVDCFVSVRAGYITPDFTGYGLGFRVCR